MNHPPRGRTLITESTPKQQEQYTFNKDLSSSRGGNHNSLSLSG